MIGAALVCGGLFAAAPPVPGLPQLAPVKVTRPDIGPERTAGLIRRDRLQSAAGRTPAEDAELDALTTKYGEISIPWSVTDLGCSWYCAGGAYKSKASSSLGASGPYRYDAESAHDHRYNTAWVEGVAGPGLGEYIEYYFRAESPRVTAVIVSNGYLKSKKAWTANNRVKKLKLYENGRAKAVLLLEDSATDQRFDVGTLGHRPDGADLVLRFEILEVYAGERHDDTALTEIYFDGIDVH